MANARMDKHSAVFKTRKTHNEINDGECADACGVVGVMGCGPSHPRILATSSWYPRFAHFGPSQTWPPSLECKCSCTTCIACNATCGVECGARGGRWGGHATRSQLEGATPAQSHSQCRFLLSSGRCTCMSHPCTQPELGLVSHQMQSNTRVQCARASPMQPRTRKASLNLTIAHTSIHTAFVS